MALQSSGLITLAQIQAEFGGSNPISLSEYYRGGAYVTANNTSVPTSGSITLSNFYGAAKQFTFTLSTNQENWNLRSAAITAGWDGSAPLIANISSGVYVWSDTTSTAGLIVSGAFPGGLIVNNSGFIMGRGGDGAINTTGNPGGPGVTVSLTSGSATFNNQPSGYIGGGGGGGAGGAGGGGAGGGRGGNGSDTTGGAGGAIGLSGGNATSYGGMVPAQGGGSGGAGGFRRDGVAPRTAGGGGGRIFPGVGGAGGYSSFLGVTTKTGGSAGNAGTNGGGEFGGGGGGWGAAGGNGTGSGGAGGAAISGSGYTVTGTTSQIYGSY